MSEFGSLTSAEQVETLMPLARELANAYSLGDGQIESINHEFNSTFKLTQRDGTKHALRININSQRTLENVRAEMFWVRALSAVQGLKVPEPIPNLAGEFISTVWHDLLQKDLWAVVFSWLEGEELGDEPSADALRATGAAMARMHGASRETKLPAGASLTVISDFFWGGTNSIATDARIADPARARLLDKIGEIQQVTDRLYANAHPQIIHADVHGWNVMWDGREVAIFDFDDCAIGLPMQDLAVTFYYLDTKEQEQWLIEGYESVAPLPEYDQTDMDALILQRRIFLLNYLLETENPEHRDMVPRYLERTLELMS